MLKRILKSILRMILRPFLSKYQLIVDKLDKNNKQLTSIMSVLSIKNPIAEYPPAHGTLRKIQLAKRNILFAFDQLCKEKKLQYWLHAGTHLGAVRHGGFIPWDDDIDVAMMGEDFDQFIKIVSSIPQNGKIYYYWCCGFLKIGYMENDLVFCAIDIFPFHQYYKRTSTVEGEKLKKLIDQRIKSNKIQDVPLLKMPYYGTEAEIKVMRETIMECKKPAEDGDIFEVNAGKHIFRYEWIFPLSTIPFEGRDLSVSNNSEKVLESQFGDFMMYPPDMYNGHSLISDKLRHNWRNYEKLDAFLSIDINTIYKYMTGTKE